MLKGILPFVGITLAIATIGLYAAEGLVQSKEEAAKKNQLLFNKAVSDAVKNQRTYNELVVLTIGKAIENTKP